MLELRRSDGLRLHRLSKSAQHLCIDRIGLGQNTGRASKLPHPISRHQTNFDLCPNQRPQQSSFVTTARFTNHLHFTTELPDPTDQLTMSRSLVSQTTLFISNGRVQVGLGDIHSQIDKLLFHVINNSCFLDASWPGRSCPRDGWPA